MRGPGLPSSLFTELGAGSPGQSFMVLPPRTRWHTGAGVGAPRLQAQARLKKPTSCNMLEGSLVCACVLWGSMAHGPCASHVVTLPPVGIDGHEPVCEGGDLPPTTPRLGQVGIVWPLTPRERAPAHACMTGAHSLDVCDTASVRPCFVLYWHGRAVFILPLSNNNNNKLALSSHDPFRCSA